MNSEEMYICCQDYTKKLKITERLQNPTCANDYARLKCRDLDYENHKTCRVCKKEVNSLADLKKHMTKHTKEKTFNCETCGKSYKGKPMLTRHKLAQLDVYAQYHLRCKKISQSSGQLFSKKCLKQSMKAHLWAHGKEIINNFLCNACKKYLSEKNI